MLSAEHALQTYQPVRKQEIKRGLGTHTQHAVSFGLLLALTSKLVNVGPGQTFLKCVTTDP